MYPTGSCPRVFNCTPKIHKVLPTDNIDKLPIRTIVSNIHTSNYELEKYLAELLPPLSLSQYIVNSTKQFYKSIKHDKIPTGYQIISLDVKCCSRVFY